LHTNTCVILVIFVCMYFQQTLCISTIQLFNPLQIFLFLWCSSTLRAGVAQLVQCLTMDWTTGVRSLTEAEDFFLASATRPALGPTQPPIQWVLGALTPGVKHSTVCYESVCSQHATFQLSLKYNPIWRRHSSSHLLPWELQISPSHICAWYLREPSVASIYRKHIANCFFTLFDTSFGILFHSLKTLIFQSKIVSLVRDLSVCTLISYKNTLLEGPSSQWHTWQMEHFIMRYAGESAPRLIILTNGWSISKCIYWSFITD
jgi:hypothetical protein